MSASEHEAAAQQEQATAEQEARKFDPDAYEQPNSCDEFCFTTWTNPTSEHAQAAVRHRRLAARHRKGSAELREAEKEACEAIPERDRDISPFFHGADIVAVDVSDREDSAASRFTIRFHSVPGVDAEKMAQLVDCHLARNAARGHVAPEMPYCPLVPRGVSADVRSVGDGVEVELEVDDPGSRAEVERRVRHLVPDASPRPTAHRPVSAAGR